MPDETLDKRIDAEVGKTLTKFVLKHMDDISGLGPRALKLITLAFIEGAKFGCSITVKELELRESHTKDIKIP